MLATISIQGKGDEEKHLKIKLNKPLHVPLHPAPPKLESILLKYNVAYDEGKRLISVRTLD